MPESTKKNKKMVFYTYQIDRGETENEDGEQHINNSIIKGMQSKGEYAQSVGYHLDPSRYDTLRGKKPNIVIPTVDPAYDQSPLHHNETVEDTSAQQPPVNNELQEDYQQPSINNDLPDNYDSYIEDLINSGLVEDELSNYSVDDLDQTANESFGYQNIEQTELSNESYEEPVQKPVFNRVTREEHHNNDSSDNPDSEIGFHKHATPGRYVKADISILPTGHDTVSQEDYQIAEKEKEIIDRVIFEYGIAAHVEKYIFGPTVTVYLVTYDKLSTDVKVLQKLDSNLQTYLQCSRIRILTPIPGKNYSGIEVARKEEHHQIVHFRDVIESKEFKDTKFHYPIVVGKDSYNQNYVIDLIDLPHAISAGQTKSGKSVCLNTIIMSLLCSKTPDEVRLVLLDPKRAEFNKYRHVPHLAMPVITDEEYFEPAFEWLVQEMERRYEVLDKYGAVEFLELNSELVSRGQKALPLIVVVMDEFNDWFQSASNNLDICVQRLLAKARACGISIILATQHPSSDVIKGSIKANIPSRFAFSVGDASSSVIMLGYGGAERLQGKGDMFLRCPGMVDTRLQCAYVSNKDIQKVVEKLIDFNEVNYLVTLEEICQSSTQRGPSNGVADPKLGRNDELFVQVAYYVVQNDNPSVNQLKQIYGVSVNRMDTIFKDLEYFGIVSHVVQGTKRKVLVNEIELEKILEENDLE